MLASIKTFGRFPRILPNFRHVSSSRTCQALRNFSHEGSKTQAVNDREISQLWRRPRALCRSYPHIVTANPAARGFQTSTVYYEEVQTVQTPPFAESVSEGDVRWEKAVGDYVNEDEVVGEIETDKTSIPVPSPVSGIIVEFLAGDGDTVIAGQELFKVQLSGDAPPPKAPDAPAPSTAAPTAAPTPQPPPPQPTQSVAGSIPTSPPPVPPMPTAPMTSKPAASVTPMAAPVVEGAPVTTARTEQRVKMSRMRLRIAQRLKDAQNTAAMLTTFNEIDMSNIIEMRKKHREDFQKKHNLKLGFMSAFIKAAAHGLSTMPEVNAVIDEAEIVYRDYIDISVAVATPKGLVVPVLRDVGGMNYAEIEKALSELGEKARSGTLAIEDMDGGTFTISNGGVFGSMFGTPIINPPQSAILGMHATNDRPVAINGKVEIRPMMYVALTYDHRLIDGREAVTFLKKIKSAVEDPTILLLDL
ncbi:dihydrolipoyllysine-residue succinyltransferase component of 2-oxoglutarate dehydrogenase complex, mitochondrial-like [Asterias rubens]|uniref:dihydrolipoyllysine-residue succinyltransferase component of 2-oxoglutarate dehydrogenase complex, mitochondrial-like n=1 Tax=Asterias rubens TaxID=7604 RepID=UPI001455B4FD|nr:dihydrolipoyllysine-residue succinyltransferase component of 2-oxoglutarate dehydrogenase complex, mitochondrial-like [Asterias rubens]